MEPETLSVVEAAQVLGIGADTVRRLIRDGHLGALTVGRRIRVPRLAIDQLLDQASTGLLALPSSES